MMFAKLHCKLQFSTKWLFVFEFLMSDPVLEACKMTSCEMIVVMDQLLYVLTKTLKQLTVVLYFLKKYC